MKKKKEELPEVEPVKLPVILGMRPGVWLSILYLLIFLLIAFLPGLISSGVRTRFESVVPSTSLYVDGNYEGGTPITLYLESGEHQVEFRYAGETLLKETIRTRRPLFFSWLFPRYTTVSNTSFITNPSSKATITNSFLSAISSESLVTNPSDIYHVPPLFTDYYGALGGEVDTLAVETALNFVTNDELAANATEALGRTVEKIELPEVLETPGTYEGLMPQGLATLGNAIAGVNYGEVNIQSRETTEYEWALFVEENPYWSKDNLETIVADGNADEYYLAGITLSTSVISNRPIRNISYKAAVAYTEWLSEKYGREVFLMSEELYMRAVATSGGTYQRTLVSPDRSAAMSALRGGLWEFTSTDFIPSYYAGKEVTGDPSAYPAEYAKIIKGGSYLVPDTSEKEAGVMLQNETSEYAGFRVCWR